MPAFRILLATAILILGIEAAVGGNDSPADFESCRVISENQARLDCFKRLVSPTPSEPAGRASPESSWPLIRTPRPGGGPSAIAVMRTPDTLRSDPDLAGLMIRCREKPGLEVLLALVRPLPPRSKKDVIVTSGTTESTFKAETSDAGTGLVLPVDAAMFTTGPWREWQELAVRIRDPEGDIRGVVPLAGAGQAIAVLSARCPPG